MVNDNWGGFAEVHAFGFDNLEFAFVVSRVDHFLYLLAKLLTTLRFTVRAITDKYELSVITHEEVSKLSYFVGYKVTDK